MRVVVTHLTGAFAGKRLLFEAATLTIGRARDRDIRLGLHDTRASSRHAEIRVERGKCVVVDVGSTNFTFVDDKKVDRARLKGGEVITFGYGGPQVRVDLYDEIASARPSLDEAHEFPFRAKFAWFFFASATLLAGVAVVSFIAEMILAAIPAGLAAAVLMLGGLSAVRVNITVGPDGIEHEAMFSIRRIAWGDIATLETLPRRTGMLGGQRCTVRGWNSVIKFSPDDYEEGFLLASLIAQASGKEWGPPGSPIA